jgi:diguanylate cyclase (GGDEF)-like protein
MSERQGHLPLPAASFADLRRLYATPALIGAGLAEETTRRALHLAKLVLRAKRAALGLSAGAAAPLLRVGDAELLTESDGRRSTPYTRERTTFIPLQVPLLPSGQGANRVFGVLAIAPTLPEWSPALLAGVADQIRALLVLDAMARGADRDRLTGLLTRAAFERALPQVAEACAAGGRAALLMLDVDDLRGVNRRRGYQGGDEVLLTVASVVQAELPNESLAGRYGGDELAVLLLGASEEEALALAQRIVELVGQIPSADGRLGVSVGVTLAPDHGETGDQLALRADQALATAKQRGKGCAVLWSQALRKEPRRDRLAGILTGDQARDYRNVEALLDTVSAVSSLAPLEDTLREVVDRCLAITGAERGLLLLRNSEGAWTVRVARSQEADLPPERAGFAATVAEAALEEGRALFRLARPGEEISASAQSLGLTGVLCAPLAGEDVPSGVVYVDARASVARFDEPTIAFFGALAGSLGTALRNVALYERLLQRSRRLAANAAGRAEELDHLRRLWARAQPRDTQGYEELVGTAPAMREVYGLLASLEGSSAPVLVVGESGTGKELVARAIHARSARHEQPFVTVNCAALTATLLESQLFGHVRGAFTGAHESRPGLVEAAHEGTLFLDEVGELPPAAQAKLLRVLQEGEVRRVGDTSTTRVDVRVLAATHRDLQDMLERGEFREDLFYRLAVFRVRLPPLRERPGDIALLTDHLLAQLDPGGAGVSPPAREVLLKRGWRGNVRELRNVLERALALARGQPLGPEHVEGEVERPQTLADRSLFDLPLKEAKAAFASIYAKELVAREGSISAAARKAGAARQTLYRLLEKPPSGS